MKLLRLNHRGDIPLHAQVEQILRDLIQRPEYQAGALLPDEMSLARRLGISRGTLRAGIQRLTYEGLLERRAGVGTRAATRPLHSGMAAWHSFTHEMEERGVAVQTFWLEQRVVRASGKAAAALGVRVSTQVLNLQRLRGWDNKPAVLFTSWLHPRLKLSTRSDFSRPLYEVIEQTAGVAADRSREEIFAVTADARLAGRFGTKKGAPLLRRQRLVLDAAGRPIEYAVVHYRSDRFTLTLDLRREPK